MPRGLSREEFLLPRFSSNCFLKFFRPKESARYQLSELRNKCLSGVISCVKKISAVIANVISIRFRLQLKDRAKAIKIVKFA